MMPRTPLPSGRGRIHVPLLVVCVVFLVMAAAAVAGVIWLARLIMLQIVFILE